MDVQDRCVVCGAIVPEGIMVCPQCYPKKEEKPKASKEK